MTDSIDRHPIPAYAAQCWTDDNNVYVAMPVTGMDHPYIMAFPISGSGFSKALDTLRGAHRKAIVPIAGAAKVYEDIQPGHVAKIHPKVTKVKDPYSVEERAAVRNILRRMGVIS